MIGGDGESRKDAHERGKKEGQAGWLRCFSCMWRQAIAANLDEDARATDESCVCPVAWRTCILHATHLITRSNAEAGRQCRNTFRATVAYGLINEQSLMG